MLQKLFFVCTNFSGKYVRLIPFIEKLQDTRRKLGKGKNTDRRNGERKTFEKVGFHFEAVTIF